MRHPRKLRYFYANEEAVSEEFTTLPVLSVVMIGFALFLILLSHTFLSYEERMEQLSDYQTADTIVRTLTNPDCYFIREGGLADIGVLRQDTSTLQSICEQWRQSGVRFLLQIHWDNSTEEFPAPCNLTASHRIAISRPVSVFLSVAQTVPGILTLILWRDP
jgi:hypothetical protein